MHEIDRFIAACRALIETGSRGIIVTVIHTEGSTYRRAGARVVISEDGTITGAISGGCLERDLSERMREWLAAMTPRLITYDSTRSDDIVFGLGLGCRGILDLLIEPFDASHPPRLVIGFQWNLVHRFPWPAITRRSTSRREIVIDAHRDVARIVPFEDAAIDIDRDDDLRQLSDGSRRRQR